MAEQSEGPLNIDVELEELEYRLERLRSLYEQYFLGIEKIEPGVARKDVDRRIWTLRREKFRNTAKRFKLQTLIQRYNTYQQHWSRICREIELGTFKRHLLKAEKILAAGKPKERKEEPARTAGAVRDVENELAQALEKGVALGDSRLDELLGLRTPTGMKSAVVPPLAAPGTAGARPVTRNRVHVEKLDLDLDDLLGGGGAPIGNKPRSPAPEPSAPSHARPSSPSHAKPPPSVGPMAGAAPRMPRGVAPPVSRPDAAPPPVSRPDAAPPPPPVRAGPPPMPTRAGPPPVPHRAPPPPVPSRPAGPPPAPPAARAPAPPPAQSPGLSDERVRELHARLSDAKRQVRDEKAISVDGLGRQLRQAEQDLRQRHGARSVDFDVVIKDGRAILKPVVKK